jgi:DNA repair exonuclease SbcCD nuclease subunit
MKIGVIGDPHLGCTIYTDKRASDFSAKFNSAVEDLQKRRVGCIVVLGDFFDSSAYRRNIDTFASRLAEIAPSLLRLKDAEIPIFAIAGNHEYGRGRTGGELRVLSDLGIIRFLENEAVDYEDVSIAGISWKSEPESFRMALEQCGPPTDRSILLIHQFCAGSRCIPSTIADVTREDLEGWPVVFAGHHHQYENIGYAIAPGSLEVHSASEVGEKGFVVYDTGTRTHEFVPLTPLRAIRTTVLDATGKTAHAFEREILGWVHSQAEEGAILVIRIEGTLEAGKSTDIRWGKLRYAGIQSGCLKVHFTGGLSDRVRTASEIRETVNFHQFLQKRFGQSGEDAIQYINALRERGDAVSEEIITRIQDGREQCP